MLNLYRAALHIRRSEPDLGDGQMRWLDAPDDVLAFSRGDRFVAITNLSPVPVDLPVGGHLLLSSADLEEGRLAPDASAWIRIDHDSHARLAGSPTREAE
jgi:alpha-glucosidase